MNATPIPWSFACTNCGSHCERLRCQKCGQRHGLVKPSPPWFEAEKLLKRWKR